MKESTLWGSADALKLALTVDCVQMYGSGEGYARDVMLNDRQRRRLGRTRGTPSERVETMSFEKETA